MKASAILAAAGSGLRLKRTARRPLSLPKALWPLNHQPILNYSLKALLESPLISEIIVVVPPRWVDQVKTDKTIRVVPGASTRALSVYEGLKRVSKSSDFVLVHDAARPMITVDSIDRVIRTARKYGAAIAAKRISSTIKEARGGALTTVPRERFWEAQTPQVARKKWLEEAYRHFFRHPFEATDEAGLLEAIGKPVKLVPLNHTNLKITTGEDWNMVQKLLDGSAQFRIGHGSDIHRLVAGRPLILGGQKIKWPLGPLGHSDGDALLHALSDAILGAVGKGDIGEYFSDRAQRNKNISSLEILAKVTKLASKGGWQIENADCIIHLEKPRLAADKDKIRHRLAGLLGLDSDAINIKAKTGEGFGPVGTGEAIACEATVLMKRERL